MALAGRPAAPLLIGLMDEEVEERGDVLAVEPAEQNQTTRPRVRPPARRQPPRSPPGQAPGG